jgi:hypothetical protein
MRQQLKAEPLLRLSDDYRLEIKKIGYMMTNLMQKESVE